MKNTNILYIEDDLTTAQYVTDFLQDCGFVVIHTDTITSGISFIENSRINIVLLDLNLPDFDGFELLKSLKNSHAIPIIILSAISDTKTKVKAFRYGANDYMVKPIDLLELEARIWSLLGYFSEISISKNDKLFYLKDENIYYENKIVDLTPIEFEIFEVLLKNKNKIVTREVLASSLSSLSSHRTLDYHIKNIRDKVEKDSKKPKYLKTEYGAGYKLMF